MGTQQLLDPFAQRGIRTAGFIKKAGALVGVRYLDRAGKQV
jgi:hypothetical protein